MRNGHSDSLCLEVYFADDRPKLELEFYSLQPHGWKAILPRPSISGHPLSPQALRWVQSLMHTCTETHESCKSTARPLLPKRVLSIQMLGDSDTVVQLIETDQEHAVYAALSHCWGTEQTCITTSSTLEDRKKGIPWGDIPKTFQDAITFALRLGIHYIWVDSLCIIQDNATDWEIESSKMADVYQYATLTISATSSSGDSQGCFSETRKAANYLEINLPDDVGTCQVAIRKPLRHWNNLIPSHIQKYFPLLSRAWVYQERLLSPRVLHFCESELVWECREVCVCECGGLSEESSPGGKYYNAIKDSEEEVHLKAMAAHERLDQMMAAQLQEEERDWERALHMQHEDAYMSWETNLGGDYALPPPYTDTPEFPDTDPIIMPTASNLPNYNEAVPNEEDPNDCADIVHHFHRIIEQYSALRLTNPTDRLPALSGLCKRVQHLRGDYLAGLWSDSLCFDLMWRVNTLNLSSDTTGRPAEYRGPTWSWITAQSPVSYWSDMTNFKSSDPRFRVHEELPYEPSSPSDPDYDAWSFFNPGPVQALGQNPEKVSAVVDRPGHNPFGEIRSAVLTAEASSTTATLLYTYDSYWHGQTNKHDPARYKLAVSTSSKMSAHVTVSDSNVEIPFFADYALGVDGPDKVDDGERLTLLLVHPKVSLVVRPKLAAGVAVVVDGEPAWERVGIARISEALGNYYMVDWMRASHIKRFKIV